MDYKAWYQMWWQAFLFPLLWYPYMKFLRLILIKIFEKLEVPSIIGDSHINNTITFYFWCIVGLFVIIVSILKLKYIKATSTKVIYITTMLLYVLFMVPFVSSTMMCK